MWLLLILERHVRVIENINWWMMRKGTWEACTKILNGVEMCNMASAGTPKGEIKKPRWQ